MGTLLNAFSNVTFIMELKNVRKMSNIHINYSNETVENLELENHSNFIQIKCLPDESWNIIEIIDLQEKCSTSVVIETSTSSQSICKNIIISEDEDSGNQIATICEYTCATKFLLKDHFINYHTHEKPYHCSICMFGFKRSSSLKRHMQIHTGDKPFECHLCEYSSNRKDNLQIHINVTHSEIRPYSCKYCDFSCKLKSSFKSHMDLHSLSNSHICEKCSYRFNSEEKLKQHILAHFHFVSLHEVRNTSMINIKNENSNDETNSKAFDTSTDFPNKKILGTVLPIEVDKNAYKTQNIPSNLSLWIDSKLENVSTSINSISSESGINSNVICSLESKSVFKIECPVCKEFFSTKLDLKHHLANKHTDYKPFQCEHCGQRFKIKVHLKQHLVVHSDAKPFKCEHCDYSTKLPETLKRHLVTHSKERPFHCPHCSYKAKLKEKLKRHLITHSTERPFHCSFCSYSSKTKELLKKHSIVHTRERPCKSKSRID
ncbi:Zinc finger protein [Armadillidium vulgare]|nr:Zinc finger protein [Armadillidium vulgare]